MEDVQKPAKVGLGCRTILPRGVEEGLVEIVELMQSSTPPFPVFKPFLTECCEYLVNSIPEFSDFFKKSGGKPTDKQYFGWKERWTDCLGSGAQSIIEKDQAACPLSENIKEYCDGMYT